MALLGSRQVGKATKDYHIIPQGETFPLSASVNAISLADDPARLP